jgi:hypothetical protein
MSIRLNGSTSGYTEIDAPAVAGSNTIVLPSGNGSANQLLKNGSTAGSLEFSSSVYIDSSQRLLVGTSSSRSGWYNNSSWGNPTLQIEGTSVFSTGISAVLNSNDDNYPSLILGKSRSTSVGGVTAVSSGDELGRISFQGADGTELVAGAYISAFVDGTSGANDLPTRLVFSTTADGASSPTERMRVNNKGTSAFATTDTGLGGNATAIFAHIPAASGSANQQPIVVWNSGTAGTRYMMSFGDGATYTERGYITWNGTTMALSNASDERLKKNIVAAPSASIQLQQIQVRSFDFIEDDAHVKYGFVAQELNEIAPEAVVVGEDNEDGTVNKYWGVSNANLVPMLTKALQEALTEIETLKAKVAALEVN